MTDNPTGTTVLMHITDCTQIGQAIAHLRTMSMTTQNQLADAAGCHRGRITDYEHGRYIPTLATLLDILSAMGMGLGVVMADENAPPPTSPEWEAVLGQITSLIRHTVAGTTGSVNRQVGANRIYRRRLQGKS